MKKTEPSRLAEQLSQPDFPAVRKLNFRTTHFVDNRSVWLRLHTIYDTTEGPVGADSQNGKQEVWQLLLAALSPARRKNGVFFGVRRILTYDAVGVSRA